MCTSVFLSRGLIDKATEWDLAHETKWASVSGVPICIHSHQLGSGNRHSHGFLYRRDVEFLLQCHNTVPQNERSFTFQFRVMPYKSQKLTKFLILSVIQFQYPFLQALTISLQYSRFVVTSPHHPFKREMNEK